MFSKTYDNESGKELIKAKSKAKMGRPSYEDSEKEEGKLEALLAIGFPHRQIQLYMNKHIDTLKKHYPHLFSKQYDYIDKEEKTFMVENSLWYNAVYKHNVVAQLAWLRAYKKELYNDQYLKRLSDNIEEDTDNMRNDFLRAIAGVLNDAKEG